VSEPNVRLFEVFQVDFVLLANHQSDLDFISGSSRVRVKSRREGTGKLVTRVVVKTALFSSLCPLLSSRSHHLSFYLPAAGFLNARRRKEREEMRGNEFRRSERGKVWKRASEHAKSQSGEIGTAR